MKVCFLIPKIDYLYPNPYFALGVGYLAAVLRDECELSLIDGQILSQESYDRSIFELECDVLLLSATLMQLKEALRVAETVHARLPKCRIIAGGAAFGNTPTQNLVGNAPIETVVIGEAENIILPIVLNQVTNDQEFGCRIRKINKTTEISTLSCRPDINSVPLPSWNLFSVDDYRRSWIEATGIFSLQIIGARGCPFSCSFCDKTVTGPIYRPRSIGDVIAEMSTIIDQYRPDEIFYNDDLFTVNEKRVIEMSNAMIREVGITRWSAQARVDTITAPMLESMKAAGCDELYFGVESGSDHILSILGKKTSREQIKRAFALCHSVGIKPGAYLIVGVPGEKVEDIDLTISLIREIRPSMINMSWLTPFPGTRIYQETFHLIKDHDYSKWDDFRLTPYGLDCFEIHPTVSSNRIKAALAELIRSGMEHADWFSVS